MKIGVCIKQVPASDSRIKINAEQTGIVTDEIKWEMNPYDEFALEAALQLKEAGQATEVVLLTVGGADCEARIRGDGLARGADGAIRLDGPGFEGADALGVARLLAAAIQKAEIGLVFCGKQAIDNDTSQLPPMLAETLGWPQAMVVSELNLEGETLTVHRAAGGGNRMVLQMALPAVVSTDKGLNTPRFASLKGIMMAKRKPITVWGAEDLGLSADTGGAGALVQESTMTLPPPRPEGRILEGESVGDKVKALVTALREEVKVI